MNVGDRGSDEVPGFIVEAMLSTGPPGHAVDLIKDAFAWRTIEAELLTLFFDSALDPSGIRDPDPTRVLEWTGGDISIVAEITDFNHLTGQLVPPSEGTAELRSLERAITAPIRPDGRFAFDEALTGPVSLRIAATETFVSQTFVI